MEQNNTRRAMSLGIRVVGVNRTSTLRLGSGKTQAGNGRMNQKKGWIFPSIHRDRSLQKRGERNPLEAMARPFPETFVHCPACGVNAMERAGGRLECGGCGHLFFVNATVAVAVIPELVDGRVLWIRRAKEPGKGKLAMPGGFVDAGETLESAARREVEEEIGLTLDRLEYVTSAPNRYCFREMVYDVIDVFFHARVREGAEWSPAEEEVAAVEMWAMERVPVEELAFPSMRSMTAWTPWVAIFLVGGLGCVGRLAMGWWFGGLRWGPLPMDTLTVNLIGSFCIGMLAGVTRPDGGWTMSPLMRDILMVGFLGGFTTFSKFSLQMLDLYLRKEWGIAVGYLVLTVVGCLVVVWVGWLVATATVVVREG